MSMWKRIVPYALVYNARNIRRLSARLDAHPQIPPDRVERTAEALVRHSFGVLPLFPDESLALLKALHDFQRQSEFRFPPVEQRRKAKFREQGAEDDIRIENILYCDALKVLFRNACAVFCALASALIISRALNTRSLSGTEIRRHRVLEQLIQKSSTTHLDPFGNACSTAHRNCVAFENKEMPFSTSYFNLFNYNYGALNAHRDRCVLTAIFSCPSQKLSTQTSNELCTRSELQSLPTSQLWVAVQDAGVAAPAKCSSVVAHKDWFNADSIAQSTSAENGKLLFLVGEELHALSGNRLSALTHCVRVDPTNPDLIRRPFDARDPAASATGNRLSAALVLSDVTISDLISHRS